MQMQILVIYCISNAKDLIHVLTWLKVQLTLKSIFTYFSSGLWKVFLLNIYNIYFFNKAN